MRCASPPGSQPASGQATSPLAHCRVNASHCVWVLIFRKCKQKLTSRFQKAGSSWKLGTATPEKDEVVRRFHRDLTTNVKIFPYSADATLGDGGGLCHDRLQPREDAAAAPANPYNSEAFEDDGPMDLD